MTLSSRKPAASTEALEQVRQIVSGALDAVVTIDREGEIVEWNRQAEKIFGWRREEAMGRDMSEMIIPHAMRQAHNRGMSRYLEKGEGPILNKRIEIIALRRDGSEFPVELSVTPIRLGDELRFSAFIRDITDDKEARKTLEETTGLLGTLIDALNSAVLVEDHGRRILHVNTRFCSQFGIPLSPAELKGSDCRAGLGQVAQLFADPGGFLALVDALIQGGRKEINQPLMLADGRVFELDYFPIGIDQADHQHGHLWHYRDISERKTAELELAERSAQLASISSLSPDGFATVDAEGSIQFANPAFEKLTGLPLNMIIGSRIAQLDGLLMGQADPGHDYASMIEPLGDSSRAGDYEDLMYLKPPMNRVLKRTVRYAENAGDGNPGQVIYLRDVTHETEVDRMKSEFLATAAHELRTPMASVYGFSELLLMQDYDRKTSREVVETIHSQSKRLISLLNELLDLARIEARAGKDFNFEKQQVEPVIRQTFKSLMIPGDSRPVKSSFRKTLPEVSVDSDKLQQALTNVISNAYKYSPDGGDITLRTSVQENNGSTYVSIVVKDNGIGMTADQLERIFERFYRANSSGNIPGTGLGMCLVKEIMELHGGEILVESEFGKGTAVTLLLPAAQ